MLKCSFVDSPGWTVGTPTGYSTSTSRTPMKPASGQFFSDSQTHPKINITTMNMFKVINLNAIADLSDGC